MSLTTGSRLQYLLDTGLLLASEHRPDVIVRTMLEAGLQLCQATVGACWSGITSSAAEDKVETERGPWLATPGAGCARSPGLRRPPLSALFGVSAGASGVWRSDGTSRDHGFDWQPSGTGKLRASSLRSYLAVAVRDRSGAGLGTFLYGHPEPGAFPGELEPLMSVLAAQAAAAFETARLLERRDRQVEAAEDALGRQQAARLRLLHALEAAQIGTWTWNADTGMVDLDAQAAELFAVGSQGPQDRDSLRRRVHPEDLALTAEDLRAVARSGQSYSAEYRMLLPEGGHRWVLVRGSAIGRARGAAQDVARDAAGEEEGMIGTVQDITPRKDQEQALRTSERLAATGRLAATLAHEINNPLEAVTNLIYLAKTDPETPASISRMLEIADGELARVSQLAQHTLGFYRDTTRPVTIDMNELLAAIVELFQRKLTGKRVECTLDLEPGLSVVGLQGEIRQVVSNLLVNAIDATPGEGGMIRIRGRHRRRAEGKGVAVLICDQGAGIPHHVRPRLFTPFMTTKTSTGTGLGLWVTRGMVEKHGGSVCFRSRTDSPSGTVFRVYLPHSAPPSLFASPSALTIQ